MRQGTLGRSALRISKVGLGSAEFGRRISVQDARLIVHAAMDSGVTLFDTADVYGDGESEKVLGSTLHNRHDRCVISTKFRHGRLQPGSSRKAVRVAVDGSLARLAVDYIDIYQVHGPDPAGSLEETIGALKDLVAQGKILYYGVCNVSAWEVADAYHLSGRGAGAPLSCVQAQVSLAAMGKLGELGPAAGRFGLGLLAASPLARGLLGGAYSPECPPDRGHRLRSAKGVGLWGPAGWSVLEQVRKVAREHDMSVPQAALAALLVNPEISAVLVGASAAAQITELGSDKLWKLPEEAARYLCTYARAEGRSAEVHGE
jgi:1-deoxyxylulose-5-phosphate synthase